MKMKRKKKRERMIKMGSKKAKSRREGKRRRDITWSREGEPGTCRFTQSSNKVFQ